MKVQNKKCGTCSLEIGGEATVVGKMHFHVSYVGCQEAMNTVAAANARLRRQGALRSARWEQAYFLDEKEC